jgi:glycosyltransferase involved in cell wall biosynthesis
MNVLFVHLFAPGQFEHIAKHLVIEKGHRCTFVCEKAMGTTGGIRRLRSRLDGMSSRQANYYARPFEEGVRRAAGVYRALKALRNRLRPDLIVGHSGFGSTLFLPELFPDTPIINYFEYFCHPRHFLHTFRPEWVARERDLLRARARNAMMMLDLENCTAAYTPTNYQRSLFPAAYRSKIRVIHDGIDTDFWRRQRLRERRIGRLRFDGDTRIVTYVSRGLEATRGFDIFLKVAKKIYEADPRVVFLVVGGEKVHYGNDLQHIRERSFFRHAWNQGNYDLRRFRFLGQVSRRSLTKVLSCSDLHIYLTIPFVLSWSLLNAMACECTILGSDTPPVKEVILHNQNGFLRNFFDVEGLARLSLKVLKEPAASRSLGRAARKTVLEKYSLPAVLPRLTSFYEKIAALAQQP